MWAFAEGGEVTQVHSAARVYRVSPQSSGWGGHIYEGIIVMMTDPSNANSFFMLVDQVHCMRNGEMLRARSFSLAHAVAAVGTATAVDREQVVGVRASTRV